MKPSPCLQKQKDLSITQPQGERGNRRRNELDLVLERENPKFIVETKAEISINAITRTPCAKTMRLVGHIGNEEEMILLDSISTDNFLDLALAKRVRLEVDYTSKVVVKIANVDIINNKGCCSLLTTRIQGIPFTASIYLLILGGCDMS